MLKYICDGHEYTFNPLTSELRNNYGIVVARVELARDSQWSEYNHYLDVATDELIHAEHEGGDFRGDCNIGLKLTQLYVAFNS